MKLAFEMGVAAALDTLGVRTASEQGPSHLGAERLVKMLQAQKDTTTRSSDVSRTYKNLERPPVWGQVHSLDNGGALSFGDI